MKKSVLLPLAVVLAIAGVITLVMVARARAIARAHPHASKINRHGEGIDRTMTALKAMFAAPTGATPCETAWLAFKAAWDVGHEPGRTPLVLKLAPHDDFLTRCTALPAGAQPCLAVAYSSRHREECVKARPPESTLQAMFELKPMDGVQAGETDADQQFMSTSKPN
jgi:hypothetical protein